MNGKSNGLKIGAIQPTRSRHSGPALFLQDLDQVWGVPGLMSHLRAEDGLECHKTRLALEVQQLVGSSHSSCSFFHVLNKH